MPGTSQPLAGVQAIAARIGQLAGRIAAIEAWQRSASGVHQPGTVTQWGGAVPPAGALTCDGSTFDPALYPQLFAALGSDVLPTIATTPITVIWTGSQSSV